MTAEATGGVMVCPDLNEATSSSVGSGVAAGAAKLGWLQDSGKSTLAGYAVVGGYANNDIDGLSLGFEMDYLFKTSDKPGAFAIGPYGGFGYYFDPNGALGDVVLDGTVGGYLGLKATVGGFSEEGADRVRLVFLFGYQAIEFDTVGSATSDKLDMSGMVAQLGFQF